MARGAIVEVLLNGLRDANNAMLAAGKVYTYAAGGTTDKATYTDIDLTTPAANPIILDAYGRAQVYADGIYRFVVKTSADASVYDWDDLPYSTPTGWTAWTPTYPTTSAGMTFTSVTTTFAYYIRQGDMVTCAICATGTTGGSAGPGIDFVLPVTSADIGQTQAAGAYTYDAADRAGMVWITANSTIASVRKYDASNWALAASKTFSAVFSYYAT